ncbi:MAG TPA: DUF4384 domain-containing protein [Candidatus Limnocylindrales bacterium]|nr:DUF4384 domain-containing protein [Candidatus Limnocylindrales bacterium]
MRFIKSLYFILFGMAFWLPHMADTYAQRPERPRPPTDRGEGPKTSIERIIPVPRQGEVNLSIWTNKGCGSTYYTGEYIDVSFTVDQDSYVTLYDIDSTGNVTVLFPNSYSRDNLARAGRVYTIPNKYSGYNLMIEGPSGLELLEGITSTDGYYHWFFDGVSVPPIWSNEWGNPTTWGGKYTREPLPGPDGEPPVVTRRFEKRLQYQGPRDPNQIANYIREQIRDQSRTKIQPGYQWGRASCAFYVIHYLGYTEYDPGFESSPPSYPSQPYPVQPYPPSMAPSYPYSPQFFGPPPYSPTAPQPYPVQPYPSQPYPSQASDRTLSVNSIPPQAHVFLDEQYYGMTPLTLYNVAAGPHRLRIEKPGYITYEQVIQIKDRGPTQINAYLPSS